MTLDKLHALFLEHPDICTDSRRVTHNCLFFALKGPNFNGNEYAKEALDKGAAYAIVDEAAYKISDRCILFEDALETLQKLAVFHRNYSKAKIIALTGSNGKTTTKELINAVLSKKYRTVSTQGNLNNHIGVPLTLLSIKADTEIAIVEMGANHQGEIAFLSNIVQPDFGYITNFGKAHLEGFGGVEGVIKGKSELYNYLLSNDKHVFLNADDPIQIEKLDSYVKKIGFSTENPQYYIISLIETNPHVVLEMEGVQCRTKLVGQYNFSNCCAAVMMGKYFNVPLEDIKAAIESYIPENNRSQVIERNGLVIILDAYNANPTSMKAALEHFKIIKSDDKFLILGDMFELGEDADKEHQEIADFCEASGFPNVFLIGENFNKVRTSFKKFNTFDSLKNYLSSNPIKHASLLIKGSRGMALERVLDVL
ncbi:UDP-N-acetylmuramoyl-tripeptide--D-alanyl-D-alanine ligase [Muricauda sp. JGD-17]|uniref:UDP-N-acetylmuramoyl-tripeptide--D-alanyl-D-alanine ligase n=1 Tax=Flagellimonas ochracea TaxID=2696472 RepID=A0A964TDE7_9FLAO|nr:UDP-N-acetylmuramoyl-tripeptide--D-alanyl-D-alanine ligase [Allomuricauda ochracea]NAY92862.1 UDP-N-acetylmuramoyl-tripeptide--D-alanyl-D-alanine ligase [Allomuricauda ochracea]